MVLCSGCCPSSGIVYFIAYKIMEGSSECDVQFHLASYQIESQQWSLLEKIPSQEEPHCSAYTYSLHIFDRDTIGFLDRELKFRLYNTRRGEWDVLSVVYKPENFSQGADIKVFVTEHFIYMYFWGHNTLIVKPRKGGPVCIFKPQRHRYTYFAVLPIRSCSFWFWPYEFLMLLHDFMNKMCLLNWKLPHVNKWWKPLYFNVFVSLFALLKRSFFLTWMSSWHRSLSVNL